MKRFLPVLAAAALAVAGASPACASTILDYQLTGAVTASWQLDASRTPDFVGSTWFTYFNVPITVDGVHYASTAISFFTPDQSGGVEADQYFDSLDDVSGTFFSASSQWWGLLFSGSTADPTLLTGQWDLTEFGDLDFNNLPPVWPIDYHLSVTLADVPEPAAWMLMITGAALTGWTLRRRRSQSGAGLNAA